jgi:uncharacterized protein YndB with AHSA1/START domain
MERMVITRVFDAPRELVWKAWTDPKYDVTIFEDLGNSQTKITFIGNEPLESAKNSGQLEDWNQILDQLAAVVEGLAQEK